MKFEICKLKFISEVHIGNGLLADSEYTMCSDTFFSALCLEALKIYETNGIDKLYDLVYKDQLIFSDGLPYKKETLYLPTPLDSSYINKNMKDYDYTSSKLRKAIKKLKYIPINFLINNDSKFDIIAELKNIMNLGCSSVHMKAAIGGLEEPEPYGVGGYRFYDDNGIYFIIGYEKEEQLQFFKNIMESLQYTGLGGKVSSGMGKFKFDMMDLDVNYSQHLFLGKETKIKGKAMTLNISFPLGSIDEILKGSYVSIIKRSGFVNSSNYTSKMNEIEGFTKKKDAYVIGAGSCFEKGFDGQILDVSCGGQHPVYRYAKPLFWRLDK